jgi:hypothetical protein
MVSVEKYECKIFTVVKNKYNTENIVFNILIY